MTNDILVADVSSNNGRVNWQDLRNRFPSLRGAIVKATEGKTYANPLFAEQIDGARQAGLDVGAYTWDHPVNGGYSDMEFALRTIGNRSLPLKVWIDAESDDNLPPDLVLTRLLEDHWYLESERPGGGYYTGPWFWDPHTSGSVTNHVEEIPLWVSGYGIPAPAFPVPWKRCTLWQFTDNYQGSGLDVSRFMGSESDYSVFKSFPPITPKPTPNSRTVSIQEAVNAKPDSVWGQDTDARCEIIRALRVAANHNYAPVANVQRVLNLTVDGILGPVTALAWLHCVSLIQSALGVKSDGLWGPVTDAAYLAASPMR
jgi:GH25 family lysozyme M1 (1,4-beta-N-acetylmuramidase)